MQPGQAMLCCENCAILPTLGTVYWDGLASWFLQGYVATSLLFQCWSFKVENCRCRLRKNDALSICMITCVAEMCSPLAPHWTLLDFWSAYGHQHWVGEHLKLPWCNFFVAPNENPGGLRTVHWDKVKIASCFSTSQVQTIHSQTWAQKVPRIDSRWCQESQLGQ